MDLVDPLLHLIDQAQPGSVIGSRRSAGLRRRAARPISFAASSLSSSRVTSGTGRTRRAPTSFRHKPSGLGPRRIRSTLYCVPVIRCGFNARFEGVLEQRGRPLDAQMRFLLETLERFVLLEFRLQYRRHIAILRVITRIVKAAFTFRSCDRACAIE